MQCSVRLGPRARIWRFFKKLAKIQDDFVNGKTTINTVVAAAVKFDQLALAMERARETILATCELSAWVVEALVSPRTLPSFAQCRASDRRTAFQPGRRRVCVSGVAHGAANALTASQRRSTLPTSPACPHPSTARCTAARPGGPGPARGQSRGAGRRRCRA